MKVNLKLILPIIIFFLIFVNSIVINHAEIGAPYDTGNGSPPGDGILETDGNWYIELNDNKFYKDTNIICNGNLYINNGNLTLINVSLEMNGNLIINGGNLTLINVTLIFNCIVDGEYYINAKNGAGLYIYDYDNNNQTITDSTNITASDSRYEYNFYINKTSKFEMKNSEIHECGYYKSPGLTYSYFGLWINSDNALIENNYFSQNYYGIVIESSNHHKIKNNTFIENLWTAIDFTKANNCTILNNVLKKQTNALVIKYDSCNNSVFNNIIDTHDRYGIYIYSNSNYNKIVNNTIINCDWSGIYIGGNNNEIFSNKVISNRDVGINVRPPSNYNNITNNTIVKSDIGVRDSGYQDNFYINNNISNNIKMGINCSFINGIPNSMFFNNSIKNNQNGITILPSTNIRLLFNNISNNVNHGIYVEGSSPKISQNFISYNINGIYGDNFDNEAINNNTINNNIFGIYFKSNSNASAHYNNIFNNSNYGAFNEDPSLEINATHNWWGSISGPYHSDTNPMGTGDKVSDYIKYKPWLPTTNYFPIIITNDNTTAVEDLSYKITYNAFDPNNDPLSWDQSTNAEWLNWNNTNHTLWGIPINANVGNYWVCINVTDGRGGYNEHNFTLIVKNAPPFILTSNMYIASEDLEYFNDYNSSDDGQGIIIWNLSTNATWLIINRDAGILNGTPTNDEVGEYWVNVSVDDGNNGLAFTNFTLIVLNVNDRPEIITEDELIANVNTLYMVDYNATDIDSSLSQLTWSLTTNATWLDLDSTTGVLSGIPSNNDAGWYNVNISVDDGDSGNDWHDFILTVISEGFDNDPPEIITIDKVSITADELYEVIYEATDDRTPLDSLIWSYNSNASWLTFNKITRTLSGNPTLSHVGWYWVNVTVNDDEGKFDSHNFTLTVWATANEPPDILTEDDVNAVVDELYSVDYEAEDDHTPLDKLVWSLETNASDWLDIDPETGVLSGTPELKDVGSYWVKVSVFDGEDGWDFTNFTFWVTTEAITKFPPKLSNPSMTPSTGDTKTEFTFSVDYSHPEGDLPDSIQVVIDDIAYDLKYNASSDSYEYRMKLYEGELTYYFTATLGEYTILTEVTSIIVRRAPHIQPEDGDGKDGGEDNTMLYAGIGIIVIIIIVVLILLFIFLKKKKGKEEEPPVEEAQPPPPEEVPPEVPPEQPPTTEIPPEQPPTPEVTPEQVPVPEKPPTEQTQVPEVPPEQPPTPEVTPQVVPLVEPAPTEPAPMPQVEEQPIPQPQVEPQPQGQAPVPTNKTQPTIEEEDV